MSKIKIAQKAGFCYGVQRAIDLANEVQDQAFTLGELIHNPQMIAKLEKNGIKCANVLEEIPAGSTVIIRAHGVSDQTLKQAKDKNLKIIDATCPFVTKVHVLAKQMEKEGYQVILLGEKDHPEVKGIVGNLAKPLIICELKEVTSLGQFKKIGLLAQTTQNHDTFNLVEEELRNHTKDLKAIDTICDATLERQDAAKDLADQVEMMIVIGGRQSGNTKRLFNICSQITKTIHIETAQELDFNNIQELQTVGITAGASTPDWIIQEVIDKINQTS
ncbi:MAG: 4-hydroxy-3-methylbut-2-enyl diphosphate reductase [Patescibacteria group bacterium]